MLRTHTCGELRKTHAGKEVTLCGWVQNVRVTGKIGFLILRDKYGAVQVFLSPDLAKQCTNYRKESVVRVKGELKARPEKMVNKDMPTGEIEVSATTIELLNPAEPIPIDLDHVESNEEARMTYRFLDLRREKMQRNLMLRHNVVQTFHTFFDKEGFINVETPIIAKSTPEGARDYLVPSRIFPGKVFALPQSPQLFKQLCMVGGLDKYYQIARCMRDEDLRADRQPEFTQLDIEMSFVEQDDVFAVLEHAVARVWKEVLGITLHIPFKRMTHKEAMEKYHSDKPDLHTAEEPWAFRWIVDFPLFEKDGEGNITSSHHPFTSPRLQDISIIEKEPLKAVSRSYDLVLNGYELGSGSIRIHDSALQHTIFKILRIPEEEIQSRFGFFLNAFKYGTPPHGGFAIGIDRLCALMCGESSIREVIAFPKNKDSRDLMLDAPSSPSTKQLDELGLQVKKT